MSFCFKVFAATSPIDGRKCVLKKFLLSDGASLRTFQKEAGILARLEHPNILQATAIIEDVPKQRAYLELPFVAGGTLREWITGWDQDGIPRHQPATITRVMVELLRPLAVSVVPPSVVSSSVAMILLHYYYNIIAMLRQ